VSIAVDGTLTTRAATLVALVSIAVDGILTCARRS
jgi:hypothetical protein